MVIIHIAHIDTTVIGGVQTAVPAMVRAQSHYAEVGLYNTCGDRIDGIRMLNDGSRWDVSRLPAPFNRPDMVIFHEVYRPEYLTIYPTLTALNIPYVIVPHGCLSRQAQQKKWLKKAVANLLLFNRFIGGARSVQYLSHNEKDMAAFPRYASFVAGNGVSLPDEKKTSFSTAGIRFVYIGRLEMHIKGLDLLLGAVKKSESLMRRCRATVDIYGPDYDGAHQALRQMIREWDIADLVRVDNEKMGEEKKKILLSADCFIQTSRTEGMPLGPLEALGYGVPCMVTEGVGLGRIIESYGAGYQSATTIDGIAESIERFMNNLEKTESMSQSAIRLIAENFDINLIAKNTVSQYGDMLN